MLPVLTSSESRTYDEHLIKKVGLPSLVLMENAARGAVATIEEWLEPGKSVLIFCGKGNNGGDGLAVARLLTEKGIPAFLALLSKKLSPDAAAQLSVLQKIVDSHHIVPFPFKDDHFLSHLDIGVIVDGLLGTGATGELSKPYVEAVLAINGLASYLNAKVLALDIPTGMNADTGEIETISEGQPVCVLADRTVTMGTLKTGFFQGFAADLAGSISVAPLGAPAPEHSAVSYLERSDIIPHLPKRFQTASKFDQGNVLCIAGSRGMTGAAIMSSISALRSGCGLVTVATAASERTIMATANAEIMTIALSDDSDGVPLLSAFSQIESAIEKADVIALGPGIKNTEESNRLMLEVLKKASCPVVADAGIFGALTENLSLLKKRKAATILTPHSGEMARMLGIHRDELERSRIAIASAFAKEHKVVLVLKGAPVITAMPSGRVYINPTGNPAMATAGAGDVLTGMMAGILAQQPDEPEASVVAAAYLHGFAGDIAAAATSAPSLVASDIIDAIGIAFAKIEE